jgi:hypothetical protein
MINSVKLTLDGSAAGTLEGALLASDHGNVPSGLVRPIGIWDFATDTPSPVTFGSCALTIRYDSAAAASRRVPEDALRVYQYRNSAWQDITTGSVDTGAKTITASAYSPLSQIAVATQPRGTVVAIQ